MSACSRALVWFRERCQSEPAPLPKGSSGGRHSGPVPRFFLSKPGEPRQVAEPWKVTPWPCKECGTESYETVPFWLLDRLFPRGCPDEATYTHEGICNPCLTYIDLGHPTQLELRGILPLHVWWWVRFRSWPERRRIRMAYPDWL